MKSTLKALYPHPSRGPEEQQLRIELGSSKISCLTPPETVEDGKEPKNKQKKHILKNLRANQLIDGLLVGFPGF